MNAARKRKEDEKKKKEQRRESEPHQLITEILFPSKEKTGFKHHIKGRMKGNLLLLIGSSFEVLHSNNLYNIAI